jgi:hypothetical protein
VPSVMPFLQLNTAANKNLVYSKLHERRAQPPAPPRYVDPKRPNDDAKDANRPHMIM